MTRLARIAARWSLRTRLVLAIVLLVTVISSLLAVTLWQIKTRLEAIAFGDMVDSQLAMLLDAKASGDQVDTGLMQGWQFFAGDHLATAPEPLLQLAPGSHHGVTVGERDFQVSVSAPPAERAILIYDITEWEAQERWVFQMMAFGIVIALALAVMAGQPAARRVLVPLSVLSRALSRITPDQRGQRIGSRFRDRELDRIANAFDQYLERVDRFVEREKFFTTSASHEMRTPLAVILGAVEVLETSNAGDDPRTRRGLLRIRRACEDMRGFIEVSLLLSREGESSDTSEPGVSLPDLLAQLKEDHRDSLDAQQIQVTIETAEAGAQTHLRQPAGVLKVVVGNLLRNAIEHSQGGHIHCLVTSDALCIRDDGQGIDPEHLPQVFNRHFSTRPDGTGLGLDLVRRLCDRFNWQLSIDSEPGTGTTVWLRFDD